MLEKPKNILIFEDHRIVAISLARIITNDFAGFTPVIADTFPDGLEFLKSLGQVELVILDIRLPGGSGIGMIRRLRELQPGVRILIFSALDDSHDAMAFLSAGVNGYASKTLKAEDLKNAIAIVLSGKKFIPEGLRKQVTDSFFQNLAPASLYADIGLSVREREVLDSILEGKEPRDICTELGIKPKTLSGYKAKIFIKLGVDNIVDLIRKFDRGYSWG